MEFSDDIIVETGFVRISKYRSKTLKALEGEVKIPTRIAKDTGILTNHMSNVLRDLSEHGLVECINPEAKRGRLYRITPKGSEVVKYLDEDEDL